MLKARIHKFIVPLCLALSLSFGILITTSFATTGNQGLKSGEDGYVGALNDRPSNAFTPSNTKSNAAPNLSITPDGSDLGYWFDYEPTSIKVLVRPQLLKEE